MVTPAPRPAAAATPWHEGRLLLWLLLLRVCRTLCSPRGWRRGPQAASCQTHLQQGQGSNTEQRPGDVVCGQRPEVGWCPLCMQTAAPAPAARPCYAERPDAAPGTHQCTPRRHQPAPWRRPPGRIPWTRGRCVGANEHRGFHAGQLRACADRHCLLCPDHCPPRRKSQKMQSSSRRGSPDHRGGQTRGGGALARGVDSDGRGLAGELEELRLGGGGVAC